MTKKEETGERERVPILRLRLISLLMESGYAYVLTAGIDHRDGESTHFGGLRDVKQNQNGGREG